MHSSDAIRADLKDATIHEAERFPSLISGTYPCKSQDSSLTTTTRGHGKSEPESIAESLSA